MQHDHLFGAERAEGPLPLGPGETWSLVKDLRWRIMVNSLKIGWRERKWAYIMMAFALCFVIGMLVLIATEDTSHTSYGPGVEPNPYFEEQMEEDEYTFEDFISEVSEDTPGVVLLSILLYFILLMGGSHGMTTIFKITMLRRIDPDHFYPTLIDRSELVESNFRRIIMISGIYSIIVFLVFLPTALDRELLLTVLVPYCVLNFVLGLEVLIVLSGINNMNRRSNAEAGGYMSPTISRKWYQPCAPILAVLQPIALILGIWQPLIGLLFLVLFIPTLKYYRRSVLPGAADLWHEETIKIVFPIQPASRRQVTTIWGAPEARAIPYVEKWYNSGIFDKKRYTMKEDGYGYDALREVTTVVNDRRNYRIPLRISLISIAITVITAFISFDLAFIPGVATFYIVLFAVMGSANFADRASFETIYLLPISGSEHIQRKVNSIMKISVAFGVFTLALILYKKDPTLSLYIETFLITALSTLFLMNFFSYMMYFDMKAKQNYNTDIQRAYSSMSLFSMFQMAFYIIFLIMSQIFVIVIMSEIFDSLVLVYVMTLLLDGIILFYLTKFFIKRSISLFDTISIIR